MSYKKLLSLLAVSTLALGACGADDTEEPDTEDTEQTEQADPEEETADSSSQDLINQAKDDSGEAFPEYGLEVVGTWTTEGYEVGYVPGEAATVPVNIISEAEEYNAYLLEDGVISEVVSDTPEIEFTVDSPSADAEYVVGVSPEDLGEAGDEINEEDFVRSEKISLVEAEAEEDAEE